MAKPRILIVDDEPNLSALVRLYLDQTQHFEVCVENRSGRALATARTFLPDLVLLDVDMPGKDGGDVAREIKAVPSLSHVPILFLTSLVSHAEAGEREIMRAGMPFLAKPVNAKVLLGAVYRMLGIPAYASSSSGDPVLADASLPASKEDM